jgi:hypothetical protein
MRKTGLEIESYIYGVVRDGISVRGSVYRGGTRPFDSKKEDAVVSFLSGRDGWDGFSQVGVVNVNVHVPNISGSPYTIRDVSRCEEVERMLLSLVERHETGDYWLQTDETPQVIPDGDNFHVVNLRIKYRYNRIN